MKKKIIILSIVIGIVCVITIPTTIYLSTYYKAKNVDEYLQSNENVKVDKIKEGYFFDGASENKALIFYPGAKVDTKAYAPLMYSLAENGYDCFLLNMPCHMAIFSPNKANSIIKNYNYQSYYLSGHSMGGAIASQFVSKTSYQIDGLILFAAYSASDLSSKNTKVISIYGSLDGVLSMDKLEKNRKNMPETYEEVCIEGGNHAQFGSYGKQKKDKDATITFEEQIAESINSINKYYSNNKELVNEN